MNVVATSIVLAHAAGAVLLGGLYFRRCSLARPPIGTFTLADVGFVLGGIVVVPLLYLAVPSWLVSGLLAIGALSALSMLVEPILRVRWLAWMLILTVS